jgi:HPt (histidine-containing phosphotransfer) domain-containing protein
MIEVVMPSLLNVDLVQAFKNTDLAKPAPLPVLDLVHLSRQTLGDGALEMELLTSFEQQAGLIVERLKPTHETSSGLSIGLSIGLAIDLAHTLKGSARAIGALGVAQKAGEYEESLRQNAPLAHSQHIKAELIDEVAAVCTVIGGLLSDRA